MRRKSGRRKSYYVRYFLTFFFSQKRRFSVVSFQFMRSFSSKSEYLEKQLWLTEYQMSRQHAIPVLFAIVVAATCCSRYLLQPLPVVAATCCSRYLLQVLPVAAATCCNRYQLLRYLLYPLPVISATRCSRCQAFFRHQFPYASYIQLLRCSQLSLLATMYANFLLVKNLPAFYYHNLPPPLHHHQLPPLKTFMNKWVIQHEKKYAL